VPAIVATGPDDGNPRAGRRGAGDPWKRRTPMKKLLLDVDELRVDSFETARAAADPRGTVRANDETVACGRPLGGGNGGHTRAACPSVQICGSLYTVCGCSVTSCDDELVLH